MQNPNVLNECSILPANIQDSTGSSFQSLQGSLDGNYLFIGGPSNRTGFGSDTGAFGIWKRGPNSLTYTYLGLYQAPDVARGDRFGFSIAVTSNAEYAVVGAPFADRNALLNTGSAYLYRKNPTTDAWTLLYQFRGSDTVANHNFGYSTAFTPDSQYMAIAAPRANLGALAQRGQIYIYKKQAGTDFWAFLQAITSATPTVVTGVGTCIEFSYDATYIVAGTIGDRINIVFKKDPTTDFWSEITRFSTLTNQNVGSNFSMSSNAEYILQLSGEFTQSSSSFVYKKEAGTDFWRAVQLILPPANGATGMPLDVDAAGSISASGSNILIGSSMFNSSYGAAFLYTKRTTTDYWDYVRQLVPARGQQDTIIAGGGTAITGSYFGSQVKLIGDGSLALSSAPRQSTLNPNVQYAGVVWPFSLSDFKTISTSSEYLIGSLPPSGRMIYRLAPASSTISQTLFYRADPYFSNAQYITFSTSTGNTVDLSILITSSSFNTSYQFVHDRISKWYTLASSGDPL